MIEGSTTPTTFQFAGQLQESGIGLYFYQSRWYDSYLNRFISPDSDVPESQGVQAWDRYAFVNNNPVRYTDPTGHWVETALDIGFILYDLYDINSNGLTWTSGLSLAADVIGAALPVVTGGGLAVRTAMQAGKAADKAVDVVELATKADDIVDVVSRGDDLADALAHADDFSLPDNALVCRGGACDAGNFING